MKVAIIGSGYVGLVVGAGLADCGNEVICIDRDAARVETLERGQIPFYEPGLGDLVQRNLEHRRLSFSTDLAPAVASAQVVILAVGTPDADGGMDLSQLWEATDAVAHALRGWTLVVNKSTAPVGTAAEIERRLAAISTQPTVVAANPEFLKEGDAVQDFLRPDRVIVGCEDERGIEILRELYAPLLRLSDRLQVMDRASAELTKLAANAMLATRISFMNEMALLAAKVGADVEAVRRGIGSDTRIGPRYLFAGPGYGGSCLPKDVRALVQLGRDHDVPMSLSAAVDQVNHRQRCLAAQRVRAHFGPSIAGARIAIWGLAFKPRTDDLRESPALDAVDELLRAGAELCVFDPAAMERVRERYGDRLRYASDMYQAADSADALVLMTEWHEFRRPDFERLRRCMRKPLLFDMKNQWEPASTRAQGFEYSGVGRATTEGASPGLLD